MEECKWLIHVSCVVRRGRERSNGVRPYKSVLDLVEVNEGMMMYNRA